MFGYITPDKPNMYMKDYYLFRAYYCGLCINTRRCSGNCMRLAVNYDIAFINILVDGILGNTPKIERKVCILNPFKKREVVGRTTVRDLMVYLNVLLGEFKLKDDIQDKSLSFAKRLLKPTLLHKAKKARRILPDIAAILDRCLIEQRQVEENDASSLDMLCHPFSKAIADIGCSFVADKGGEQLHSLLYNLGKWVYLIDAVDDFDDDVKRKSRNIFVDLYSDCKTQEELLELHLEDIKRVLDMQLREISDYYEGLPMPTNEGVVTNTLWFGLEARQETILSRSGKCQKRIRL